jgi:hypothetical protein
MFFSSFQAMPSVPPGQPKDWSTEDWADVQSLALTLYKMQNDSRKMFAIRGMSVQDFYALALPVAQERWEYYNVPVEVKVVEPEKEAADNTAEPAPTL